MKETAEDGRTYNFSIGQRVKTPAGPGVVEQRAGGPVGSGWGKARYEVKLDSGRLSTFEEDQLTELE